MPELLPNTNLMYYRILRKIGAGGMGEVYLAEDTRLGRKVALKFLPAAFAQDQTRLKRFTQEARAASALNHPNILTVHEIGQTDNSHFIATEFVKGETLRERMQRESFSLREVLDIATQVASALNAAHEAKIIHRDIKPENIMLRADGLVKVLDFGLAKLNPDTTIVNTEADTLAQVKTGTGVILGTAAYMSPEQARGKTVDARTDVFSFGVVLYEMLSGKHPFAGETTSDVIAAILQNEPAPLTGFGVPKELERIVSRALRKSADERYQHVKDLLIDLKDFKQESEFAEKLGRSSAPAKGEKTAERSEARTEIQNARTALSAKHIAREIKNHKLGLAVLSVLLLAAIGLGYWFFTRRQAEATRIQSIAILPFVNESGNPDVEFLSDGISESLINSLSQLEQLKVVARATAFTYKRRKSDPREAGRELGVDVVLTGRVTLFGDTLIVQTDLVSIADGTQIWGEHYKRKLADLLSVQENISHEILSRLQPKLSSEGEKRLTDSYPDNSEAYQLYLKGRYFWNRRTEEGIRKGIGYFEQAISKDPKYALAYVGLADSYNVMGFYSFLPPKESFPKAKAAAVKALELKEELAEAHNSLAYATLYYDWNFAAAEKEFLRAIELNPNYPVAHQWYGNLLTAMGRWDEAIQEFKRAQELDPLSLVITAVPGWTYYYAREYDKAIESCHKAIEMDRNFALAHNWLGQAYERKGMYEKAISEFKEAFRLSGNSPETAALLAHAYAVSGSKRQAQDILDNLLELSKQRYVSPYHIATIYAGIGDKDRALKWLDTAYNDRQNLLVFLKHDAVLDNLRADPRFQDLLRRMGLSP